MSRIYDLSFKPYRGKRTSYAYRTGLLFVSYIKHIFLKFGNGFSRFVLYFVLLLPTISSVAQLFFSYIKRHLSNTIQVDYGAVANSSAFPLYFMISIAASFLISTITSSDYPTFMRYRKMDKGMWVSLYGVSFALMFFPMILAFIVMLIGALTLFIHQTSVSSEIAHMLNISGKWLLASIISTDIIVISALLIKKASFSSIFAATYPMIVGILLSIITGIFDLSYKSTEAINIGTILFSTNNTSYTYLTMNAVIYTLLLIIILSYKVKRSWR